MKEQIILVLRKGIALILMVVGFSCIGVAIHEFGHLAVNNILGGEGMVFFNYTLTAGHMEWITLPAKNIELVYLAGGI